jgi:hypothetical protein
MLICKICTSEVSDIEEKCSTCGWNAGPPNVRSAASQEEVNALEERYLAAVEQANADGTQAVVMSFEEDMRGSCAVVNVDLKFLHQFITDNKVTYANYDLSVKGQTRKPAKGQDDRYRRTIEAMLFGGYSEQIRYAALSLDEAGLDSYGPYSIKLREVTIEERASLLEDNSYHFIPKHRMAPGDDVPPGYVATWKERHKLAVAKLAKRFSAGTTKAEHSRILLSGKGDRHKDEYIEVHIYGGFDNKAIESVKGSSSVKGKWERATLSIVKDYLRKDGKLWVEE